MRVLSFFQLESAMKLQLIVVETGERWRRALLRMVLDSKGAAQSDYGSFQTPGAAHAHHHPEVQSGPSSDVPALISDSVRLTGLTADMTQSDIYQRQPLLPSNGSVVHSPTSEFYDSDDNVDSLSVQHRSGGVSNGVITIDIPTPQREEPRFPKEKFKSFIAFIILVVNFILTTVSLALVHERLPDRDKYGPLPDVVIDNIVPLDWALNVSEILIVVSTNVTVLVILFHKHRFIVMRRVFMILSLLYLMRSITMYVTVLPHSSRTYYCSPKLNETSTLIILKRVWQLLSGFGLSMNGQHTFCGDFIYSGHTVILTMSYLTIAEYSPRHCFPLHWASWCFSVTGVVMVLLAHAHYTVDVLIAYYVTTTLFWAYHTMANNACLKQAGPNNLLARMWWFRLFLYFERNVGGPVPRKYDWPLPWPRRWHAKHPNRNS
ncbi:phosphatidylcholine:ceramide cholinephosphotransferase 2-like isoform X2 [Bacillus rossius redtenbacheri]|uniref:phosphatidylcholine:ceramide cholinephosphotransferase 2-like isoform X2 n=1 Tax=Bacillus rossius redtenbacheri TaxID=93214 RepID=UPI002FDC7E6C